MEFSGIVFELVRNLMSFSDNLDMVCRNIGCCLLDQKQCVLDKRIQRTNSRIFLSSSNYKRPAKTINRKSYTKLPNLMLFPMLMLLVVIC